MKLTPEQQKELLEIIERNQSLVIAKEFGLEFLTEEDKKRLEDVGLNLEELYKPELDTVFTSFNLGMLSEALDIKNQNFTYNQLKDYIKQGSYIPLTQREIATIDNIKTQSFNDVKTLNGKIFSDVNQILLDDTLANQQQFLREEIAEGLTKKKTVRQIANKIAEKTGDWSRNFDRIIEYASNTAMESGKADMIERSYGEGALCYKLTYNQACKHCVRLYRTDGSNSQPRIFALKELRLNGTNIGRKTDEWKPVIGSTHPHCRCSLNYLPKNYKWNSETKQFEFEKPKMKRKPIRVIINGEEKYV